MTHTADVGPTVSIVCLACSWPGMDKVSITGPLTGADPGSRRSRLECQNLWVFWKIPEIYQVWLVTQVRLWTLVWKWRTCSWLTGSGLLEGCKNPVSVEDVSSLPSCPVSMPKPEWQFQSTYFKFFNPSPLCSRLSLHSWTWLKGTAWFSLAHLPPQILFSLLSPAMSHIAWQHPVQVGTHK